MADKKELVMDITSKLLITMEDLAGYANDLEENRCKADAEKLRKIAGRLENLVFSMRDKLMK